MRIDLKTYTRPGEYARNYDHNFHEINAIQNDELFSGLVSRLARASGVSQEIVLTDLKDYLMNMHEYHPEAFEPNIRNELALPYFIFASLKGVFARAHTTADVVVDMWYPEAIKTFYTYELERGLEEECKCLFVNFAMLNRISPAHLIRVLAPLVRSLAHCRKVIREHGLDLRKYACYFFRRILIGMTIGSDIKPKLVISGNDNCFSYLTAKAAGAEVMLIQNGKRSLHSLVAFKYADHYIGWGDMLRLMSSGLARIVFKNFYNFGSIRLYDNCGATDDKEGILYDILWVSAMALRVDAASQRVWGQWYDSESEVAAVRVFINFAKKSGLRIAFQCRNESDVQYLSEGGLRVDGADYITSSRQSVYRALPQARVVLSPDSSVCQEAMALGKKVGYVNLSGNEHMNRFFKDLDIEYHRDSRETFQDFIARIMTTDKDYSAHFVQNWDYIPDLLKVIRGVVSRGSQH